MFKKYIIYSLLGTAMGYILARIGFADYDEINKMFVFADLRMFLTFAGSVVFLMIMGLLFRKYFPRQDKFFQPGTLPGSMLFGFGWAVTGACPSLVFVQLGQGKLPAIMTLFGIYLGVVLYRKLHAKYFLWDVGSCNSA
ncbi:MAG: YeeE/YedE family protein [Gammaproteobacteria bacterium]|nr:YeeE/YedE family protein [Gammaproteobacteria bacterium]